MRVYFNLDVDDVTNLRLAANIVRRAKAHNPSEEEDLARLVLRLIPGVEAAKTWTPEEILAREA